MIAFLFSNYFFFLTQSIHLILLLYHNFQKMQLFFSRICFLKNLVYKAASFLKLLYILFILFYYRNCV